jgi:hypothetical protein
MSRLLGLVVVLAPALAWGDSLDAPAFDEWHMTLGGEATVGGDKLAVGFRGGGGFGHTFGEGHLRPSLGLCLTIGGGSLEDRATSKAVEYYDIGPQLIAGLRFHGSDDRTLHDHVFTTFAVTRASVDHVGETSERVSLGINWLPELGDYLGAHRGSLLWIVPHQGEVVYQRLDDANRFGVALMYGI